MKLHTYSLIRADERDGPDIGMVADEVDGLALAVDDVEESGCAASLGEEIGEDHGGAGHALRGFQNGRVAADDADGEGPEGYHGREVEGADGAGDAQRHLVRDRVHVRGDVVHRLAHQEARDARTHVHDFYSTWQSLFISLFLATRKIVNEWLTNTGLFYIFLIEYYGHHKERIFYT